MALPDAVRRKQGSVAAYGIIILLVPTTTTADLGLYDVEVQRAPDSAGAPDTGNAETIARLGPIQRTGTMFTDSLPNDGVRRHYRWRHVRIGYTEGAYSSWLVTGGTQGAKPGPVDDAPSVPAVAANRDQPFASDLGYALRGNDTSGKEAYDDLWVLSTKTVKVGSAGTPATITKTLRFTSAHFRPATDTTVFVETSEYVHSSTDAGAQVLWAGFVLPPGVTITSVATRGYVAGGGMAVDTALYRIESDAATSLASGSHVSIASWTTETLSISESVTAARHYKISVSLDGGGSASDARLQFVDVTYTMPSYDKGY